MKQPIWKVGVNAGSPCCGGGHSWKGREWQIKMTWGKGEFFSHFIEQHHNSLIHAPPPFWMSYSLSVNIIPFSQPAFKLKPALCIPAAFVTFCMVIKSYISLVLTASLVVLSVGFMDLFSPTSWALWDQRGISATDCDQVKPLNRRRLESPEKVQELFSFFILS